MLHATFQRKTLSAVLATVLGLGLSGCIEDSDSSDDTTTIEGIAIASGLIDDGDITVTNENGEVVVSGKVNNGEFSLKIANNALTEELTFKVTGTYEDSVSGETITVDESNALLLTAPANTYQKGRKGNAPITPGSSIISYLIEDGKTPTEAQAAFKDAFGYEPDLTAKPFSPSGLDDGAAQNRPQADKDAAFRAGAFSQLASELSLDKDDIAELLTAIAEDLSDDTFDGSNGTSDVMLGMHNLHSLHDNLPLDTRVLAAYSGFAGSSHNSSGVTAPSANLPQINYDAAGTSKTITIDSGEVTVTLDTEANPPIAAGFWTSRVKHKITLQDANGNAIDVTNNENFIGVKQHPNMRMIAGHIHSTPHNMMADISDAANGIYYMDSYYVMPSQAGMGDNAEPLGLWSYSVKIEEDTDGDDEVDHTHSVVFHPQVKMVMPMDGATEVDVLFSVINNTGYQWTTMAGVTETRPFRVWLHEITRNNDSSHALAVFVSTRDMKNPDTEDDGSSDGHNHMHGKPQARSMEMDEHGHGSHDLMSFPAVFAGQKLHGPLDNDTRPMHTLSTVTVEVSNDEGMSWQAMQTDGETGRFTLASLAGLSTSNQNTLSFRVMINDGTTDYELKTNGGNYGALKFTAPTQ